MDARQSSFVEELVASAQLSSDIDIHEFLSEEVDSSADDTDLSSADGGGSPTRLEPIPSAEGSGLVHTLSAKLQGALSQRNAEMNELERQYRAERRRDRESIRKLRGDSEALRRTALGAQAKAANEMRMYRASVDAVQARSRAELEELRTRLQAFQAEAPAFRQRLATGKAEFAQLIIDSPTYEAFRKRREDELSVVEHVQMRVYDLVTAVERKAAVSIAAVPSPQPQQPPASVAATVPTVEAASLDALRARLDDAIARAAKSQDDAAEARSECLRLKQEAAVLAATPEGRSRAAAEGVEQQIAELKTTLMEVQERLRVTQGDLERSTKRVEEAEATKTYLAQDKEYLRVQVASLEERSSVAEQRVAKKDASLAELKAELSRTKEELLQTAKGAAEDFSLRLEAEHARWKAQELSSHNAHAEAHQTALSTHRDAREFALAEADKWQTRFVELRREHDSHVQQTTEAIGRAEAANAELRAECKLRTFEAERLRMQTEQAMVGAREAQIDTQAVTQKLDVLKAEYHKLQVGSASQLASLEAQVAALSEREQRLDQAVLQSGGSLARGDAEGCSESAGGGSALAIQSFLRDGTQGRESKAEAGLNALAAENGRLQGMIADLQKRIGQSGQPQSYLADQLDKAENERLGLESRVAALQQELVEHVDALTGARQQNELLLRDLESLLSQRGSLDALRTTLTRLLPLKP